MPRDFGRNERVAELMRRELAELIRTEVKDPRVGSITVADVALAPSMARATVYVTPLNAGEPESREAIAALNRAVGFLRRRLGRELNLRYVPALHFEFDPSFDRGARLSALIDSARRDDSDDQED